VFVKGRAAPQKRGRESKPSEWASRQGMVPPHARSMLQSGDEFRMNISVRGGWSSGRRKPQRGSRVFPREFGSPLINVAVSFLKKALHLV
jgi:hypothetical protein